MSDNRICLACGKSYEYCGSCPSSLNIPVWKNLFDSENCKNIFETASDYAQKIISKERAKNKLSTCDLSQINNFKIKIKDLVNEIITEEKKEKSIKRNVKSVVDYAYNDETTNDNND